MEDIKRICTEPTAEDRAWLPDIAGKGDWIGTLKDAWANHRDESFIRQFMSPALMRKFRLFNIFDDSKSDLAVRAIHNERGYRAVRTKLANQFDVVRNEPEIEVVDVDLDGDRRLMLQHRVYGGGLLSARDAGAVLQHLADLWGYDVMLAEVDAQSDAVLKQHSAHPTAGIVRD
jgi:stage V sporulation protein R